MISGNSLTKDQLKGLPHLAQVAFAARCARRVLPLFKHHWPEASAEYPRVLGAALDFAKAVARSRINDPEHAAEAAKAMVGRAEQVADNARRAGGELAAGVADAVYHASRAAAGVALIGAGAESTDDPTKAVNSAYRAASMTAFNHSGAAGSPAVKYMSFDFEALDDCAKRHGWINKTPIEETFFSLYSVFDIEHRFDYGNRPDSIWSGKAGSVAEICNIMDMCGEMFAYEDAGENDIQCRTLEESHEEVTRDLEAYGFRLDMVARTADGGRDIIAMTLVSEGLKFLVESDPCGHDSRQSFAPVRRLCGLAETDGSYPGILALKEPVTREKEEDGRLTFERHPLDGIAPWFLNRRDFDYLLVWLEEHQKSQMASLKEKPPLPRGRVLVDEDDDDDEEFKGFLELANKVFRRRFPNPERKGCPGVKALEKIAFGELDPDSKRVMGHVVACSPCCREFSERRDKYLNGWDNFWEETNRSPE